MNKTQYVKTPKCTQITSIKLDGPCLIYFLNIILQVENIQLKLNINLRHKSQLIIWVWNTHKKDNL